MNSVNNIQMNKINTSRNIKLCKTNIYLLHILEKNIKFICEIETLCKATKSCDFKIIGKIENDKFIKFSFWEMFILEYNYGTDNYDSIEYENYDLYEKCDICIINYDMSMKKINTSRDIKLCKTNIYLLHILEKNIKFICEIETMYKISKSCDFKIIGKIENDKFIKFSFWEMFILEYNFDTDNYDSIEYENYNLYEKCDIYIITDDISHLFESNYTEYSSCYKSLGCVIN